MRDYCSWLLRWAFAMALLLMNGGLITNGVAAEDRRGPVQIGQLTASWGPTPGMVGVRDGLRELGYRENEDFVIGVRFTQGDVAALPAAARELIQYGVDIIYASGTNAAKAAQMATKRVPIVFAGPFGDPVGLGLIESFARPGGNITGVTNLDLELSPKRLEIFKEMVPDLKRVLFPYDANDAYTMAAARAYRSAAQRLGIVLVEKPLRTQQEAQVALARVRRGEVDGILAPAPLGLNIPGFILEATTERAIPTMFTSAFWVERGGLASYGPDLYASGRQAARLVDKILKGADPSTIPVETNPKIEFTINAKVAEALGLTIAPSMLYRADRVVR